MNTDKKPTTCQDDTEKCCYCSKWINVDGNAMCADTLEDYVAQQGEEK